MIYLTAEIITRLFCIVKCLESVSEMFPVYRKALRFKTLKVLSGVPQLGRAQRH